MILQVSVNLSCGFQLAFNFFSNYPEVNLDGIAGINLKSIYIAMQFSWLDFTQFCSCMCLDVISQTIFQDISHLISHWMWKQKRERNGELSRTDCDLVGWLSERSFVVRTARSLWSTW